MRGGSLVLVLLLVVGCGRIGFEPRDGGLCDSVTLSSLRTHTPPESQPASVRFDEPREVALPASLSVSQGSAGNHWLRIELELDSGGTEVCCYRGGSSVSDPTTEPELELGRRYAFDRCVSDLDTRCEAAGTGEILPRAPGDVVRVDAVRLEVLNGGTSAGPTQVDWTLECP